jgi:hypothetical protein
MRTDKYQAEVVLDWISHMVHMGTGYYISVSNTIGAAGTLALHITTSTKDVVLNLISSTNKTGTMVVNEGATLVGGSTPVAYNANRNYSSTILSTFKQDATPTGGATILTILSSAGAPATFTMVLKKSTIYTITFTADSATTIATISGFMDEEA